MFSELRNRKTVDYKLLNDKGMEDVMMLWSQSEFLIEKELTPIKSRELVAVDSGEMDEEVLEKLKREQNKKKNAYLCFVYILILYLFLYQYNFLRSTRNF